MEVICVWLELWEVQSRSQIVTTSKLTPSFLQDDYRPTSSVRALKGNLSASLCNNNTNSRNNNAVRNKPVQWPLIHVILGEPAPETCNWYSAHVITVTITVAVIAPIPSNHFPQFLVIHSITHFLSGNHSYPCSQSTSFYVFLGLPLFWLPRLPK